jgi:hypothetical protein
MGCLLVIVGVVVALVAAVAALVVGLLLVVFVVWAWDERDVYWPAAVPEPWVLPRELSPVALVAVLEPGLEWTGVSFSGRPEDRVIVLADAEWRAHVSSCPVCMAAYWLDGEPCRAGRELCA